MTARKLNEIKPEVVAVNSRSLAGYGGIGHRDDAREPQQTLFSWVEFLSGEPVKTKGRSRKPILVRVGSQPGAGAGGGAGRRGTLARVQKGEVTATRDDLPLLVHVCGRFCCPESGLHFSLRLKMGNRIDDRYLQSYIFVVIHRFS